MSTHESNVSHEGADASRRMNRRTLLKAALAAAAATTLCAKFAPTALAGDPAGDTYTFGTGDPEKYYCYYEQGNAGTTTECRRLGLQRGTRISIESVKGQACPEIAPFDVKASCVARDYCRFNAGRKRSKYAEKGFIGKVIVKC